jgi:hypothetical protein
LAPAVSGTFFNGSPTLFARKPMLLLVCYLLQHMLKLLTPVALKFANETANVVMKMNIMLV